MQTSHERCYYTWFSLGVLEKHLLVTPYTPQVLSLYLQCYFVRNAVCVSAHLLDVQVHHKELRTCACILCNDVILHNTQAIWIGCGQLLSRLRANQSKPHTIHLYKKSILLLYVCAMFVCVCGVCIAMHISSIHMFTMCHCVCMHAYIHLYTHDVS